MVGHVDSKSVDIAGDYPELFADLLAGRGIELVRYDVDLGRLPDSVHECNGWMCGPSRSSTYEGLPWQADAEALLREIVNVEVPYVGICFGHQLLAQALGARVERAADGWQVGAHDYELVEQTSWMEPPTERITLIASHQDQVAELPEGAALLFRGADGGCPDRRLHPRRASAWTLQPHPEFIAPLADHLLAGRVALIGEGRVSAARASLAQPLDNARVAGWIAGFFAESTAP